MSMTAKYPGITAFDASRIVTTLRQVKTPYELSVLDQSAAISSASPATERITLPGMAE